MRLRDPHDPIASLDLLGHQRFRGGHEHHLARRKPAVEVVHDHGGDEGLAQARGQAHERVATQGGVGDAQLVVPHGAVGGVNPHGPGRRAEAAVLQAQPPLGFVHGDQQHVIVRLQVRAGCSSSSSSIRRLGPGGRRAGAAGSCGKLLAFSAAARAPGIAAAGAAGAAGAA